jgi:hypothetical protein
MVLTPSRFFNANMIFHVPTVAMYKFHGKCFVGEFTG